MKNKRTAALIIVLLLMCAAIFGCSMAEDGTMLTLDEVERMAEKADELDWEDLRKYQYTDIGSGWFIWKIEIDEMFYLMAGGGTLNEKPVYIHLCANDGEDSWTDISEGDVRSFVDEHKDKPVVKEQDSFGEIVSAYCFSGSEEIIKPNVRLYSSGKFQFVFSALSSYVGIGEYELSEERLVLRTDDGEYTYTFEVVEDMLIFDAEDSSGVLWFSDIEDGAVFEKMNGMETLVQ